MPVARYAASSAAFAAPTSTAPFLAIQGSNAKKVVIRRIILSGPTLTAVGYINFLIKKTSTAVSGGTSTNLTAVKLNSSDPDSTASLIKVYTAAPTAGTAVGNIASRRVLGQATTAAAGGYPEVMIEFDFNQIGGVPLNSAAEGVVVHFESAPASAVTMVAQIEWTEE